MTEVEGKITPETPRVDPADPAERAAFEERVARELAEAEKEKDPAKALGFDVTDLPPFELANHGVTLRPWGRVVDAPATSRIWLTHSEVSARYPAEDRVARSQARSAASIWWERHRTLKGLAIHRSFPCLGKFRVVNEGAETGPVIVVCDVCGDCLGVQREEFDKALSDSLGA